MRKTLVAGVVVGVLSLASMVQAQSCVTGWQYKVPITIDNSANGSALTDYQVALTVDTAALVTGGKMQADGDDLRLIVDGVSCDILCHFVESGMNTASTKVWVKVPAVAANSTATIWMVYGNPAAASNQNASCTFDFWEASKTARWT